MKHHLTIQLAVSCALLFADFLSASLNAAEQPNIVWLSCEDISPHLGCYDDPHAITPNLDKFATEGVRYSHVFTAAGVCAPCRSTIITGMYHNSIGTHHMRSNAKLPQWMRPFPQLMREAGYYCTNNSKTDYQFSNPTPGEIWDESSSSAHWKNRPQEKPFFAVFNFQGCHESGIAGTAKYRTVTRDLSPEQRQDPQALTTLPPYYPDTPVTREDWKRNYELITAMDAWVGEHLRALRDAGLYENTIIFFWSDHGVGLPRAKRWLYDSGTRIPFVVRIPQQYKVGNAGSAGSISDELVNSVDFGPTVLNLAGVEVPEYMQGRAFLGSNLTPERRFVYGARDRMDERYDIIRSVRDKRYRYIRNFEPLKPYYQYMNTPEQGATMREIRAAEAMGTLPPIAEQYSLGFKPVEELYDIESDPHEVHNLALNPDQQMRLNAMREECLRWQADVRDIGLIPESEIIVRERRSNSRFDILRQTNGAQVVLTLVEAAAGAAEESAGAGRWLASLEHDDAAVRYWGAVGIGNFAQDIDAAEVRGALVAGIKDTSPSVRIAAARALCNLGDADTGLPPLIDVLQSDNEWARLEAVIVLDELDEAARPALQALQLALVDQPNKYIVRVANKAVNDLQGTAHTVP